MKNLRKWDPVERVYGPYSVPDGWRVSCYESDMDAAVNCAQCGRVLRYGECYTSREVHTAVGFGYAVCEECYRAEWQREMEAEQCR